MDAEYVCLSLCSCFSWSFWNPTLGSTVSVSPPAQIRLLAQRTAIGVTALIHRVRRSTSLSRSTTDCCVARPLSLDRFSGLRLLSLLPTHCQYNFTLRRTLSSVTHLSKSLVKLGSLPPPPIPFPPLATASATFPSPGAAICSPSSSLCRPTSS